MSDVVGERVAVLYPQTAADQALSKAASSLIFNISQVGAEVRGFPYIPGASTSGVEGYVEGRAVDVVLFGAETDDFDIAKVREVADEASQAHAIPVGREQDFLAQLIARRQEIQAASEIAEPVEKLLILDPTSPTYHDDVMAAGFAGVKDGKTRLPMLVAKEVAEAVFDQVVRDHKQLVAKAAVMEAMLTDEQRETARQQIQEMEITWQQQ